MTPGSSATKTSKSPVRGVTYAEHFGKKSTSNAVKRLARKSAWKIDASAGFLEELPTDTASTILSDWQLINRSEFTDWLNTVFAPFLSEMIEQRTKTSQEVEDDWSLDIDQMLFMLQNHNVISEAFEQDDMESLQALEASAEFRELFGEMTFDEAFDRYECAIEE